MKPLRVGLIHRDHPRHADHRMIGMWGYAVPEFKVQHIPQLKHFTLNRDEFYGHFDVLFWEDARTHGTITGDAPIPVVYYVGDSTLSYNNFHHRYQQSRQADLVLVDWDNLTYFDDGTIPVQRLPYCVNDRLFYPREKTIDVGFHAGATGERSELHNWLVEFCADRGYSYSGGRRGAYDYMEAIGSERVSINLNRNPYTRAHRCYDVMASRSCLVTSPMPYVSGETWLNGLHYRTWLCEEHLAIVLDAMLQDGLWASTAQAGYEYVQDHTWAARAKDLHAMLTAFLTERPHYATVH